MNVGPFLKIPRIWEGDNFDHACYLWYKNCKGFYTLPAIISWKLWTIRNTYIFYEHLQDKDLIFSHILKLENDFGMKKEIVVNARVMKYLQSAGFVGFFNGAASRFLLINNSHYFYFKLNSGIDSNMKVEILPL